jgi:hypothetical protein
MIPFLTGCVRVHVEPLPAPEARAAADIRGVVLRGNGAAERIEFARLDDVQWTDSAVALTGVLRSYARDPRGTETVTTRSFPFSTISGVLVRQIDPNRTSLVIGAVAIGSIAVATFLLTGKGDEGTVLGVTRN